MSSSCCFSRRRLFSSGYRIRYRECYSCLRWVTPQLIGGIFPMFHFKHSLCPTVIILRALCSGIFVVPPEDRSPPFRGSLRNALGLCSIRRKRGSQAVVCRPGCPTVVAVTCPAFVAQPRYRYSSPHLLFICRRSAWLSPWCIWTGVRSLHRMGGLPQITSTLGGRPPHAGSSAIENER